MRYKIRVKQYRGGGLNNFISPHRSVMVPTLNWVFENQPIMSGILTQPSGRKLFASRRKRSLEKGGVVICIYNYTIDMLFQLLCISD